MSRISPRREKTNKTKKQTQKYGLKANTLQSLLLPSQCLVWNEGRASVQREVQVRVFQYATPEAVHVECKGTGQGQFTAHRVPWKLGPPALSGRRAKKPTCHEIPAIRTEFLPAAPLPQRAGWQAFPSLGAALTLVKNSFTFQD